MEGPATKTKLLVRLWELKGGLAVLGNEVRPKTRAFMFGGVRRGNRFEKRGTNERERVIFKR